MSLSEMKVFNEYIMPATIETLDQMVQKFNAASRGTILLTTEGFDGDFFERSFWQSIHSAQRRVDRYAAQASVASTDLSQQKEAAVKVAGGFGPVRFEPSQLTWLRKPTAEGISVISQNLAEAIMQDQLNTAIAALRAALENNASVTYDAYSLSPSEGITQANLNNSHALFGDMSGTLLAQVMTGSVFHKLIGQNITNTNRLFNSTNVTVVEILGKSVIVTDAPALLEEGSPNADKEKVLSLAAGAAVVFDGGDMISNVQTVNGKTRIETTFQVDYTFGRGLKGYSWDETNGGKSPTDAEIATGSNWDQTATSIKHTAGVILVGDETKS